MTNAARTRVGSGAAAFGATAVLLALSATPLQAETAAQDAAVVSTHAVVVRFEKDALDHENGRRVVNARIEAAARAVCGRVDIKSFYARRLWKQCLEDAMNGALQQLDERQFATLRD